VIFIAFAKLHSLTKLRLLRWLVWLWQCVQCGSAIVLKNVRWAKNKKHRVGMSVGFLVLSIFRFSVLSQWFTFQFFNVVVCLLHLAVTDGGMRIWGVREDKPFNSMKTCQRVLLSPNHPTPNYA